MALQSSFLDYYRLLGVRKDASSEDIGRAFRRHAKRYHPDLNKSAEASQAFLGLSEAYYVLRDADRRRKFDVFRNEMLYDRPWYERHRRSQAWATALVLVGLLGAVTLMLDSVDTTDPVYDRETSERERSASAAPPAATPLVVAANEPRSSQAPQASRPRPDTPPAASSEAAESWQATVSPERMPLVTAPDILDEAPAAGIASTPVKAEAPKVSADHVAPRTRHGLIHAVRHVRAQARGTVAHVAKAWASKKRHVLVRRSTKRHYASR